MSFVSYAQNFEDVMLWRALKHVDQGFYVDVGANDPDIDSVTKAFYERGWRGINIEPVPQWFERLQEARPRDINLQLAAGREPGEIILFEIPDTGLSTAERAFVDRHKSEHGYQSRELKVHVETLTNLCERYHTAPIHFLKIDVEGMEKAVLEGLDFQKIRPWIILVESTLPLSQEECHVDWEPLLLDAGYQYAYFDGLNRFYVANEHSELLDAFKAPPNVFDDFLLSRQHEADSRAAEIEAREAEARRQMQQALEVAQQAQELARKAESRAAEIEAREAEARRQMQHALEVAQQAQELARKAESRAAEIEIREAEARRQMQQALEVAQQAQELARQAETRAAQYKERARELEATLAATRQELNDVHQSNHHHWQIAEARQQQIQVLEQRIQDLLNSWSWRITAPLRVGSRPIRRLMPSALKPQLKSLLRDAAFFIGRRPALKRMTLRVLNRFPNLKWRLERIVAAHYENQVTMETVRHNGHDLANLTPRARQIYADLKAEMEKRKL